MRPKKNILASVSRSKAAAERLAREVTVEELERALNNFKDALSLLKSREAERVRAKNLRHIKRTMSQMGLSVKDLTEDEEAKFKRKRQPAAVAARKRKPSSLKGTKIPPKYKLKLGKQTHHWTGRGRMPLVFKNHVDSGGSLESCLIKKSK